MRDFPDDSVLEPNRAGRLSRLMRHRRKRIAMLGLMAKNAPGGSVVTHAQNTSLGRSLRARVREKDTAGGNEAGPAHSLMNGIDDRAATPPVSGRAAVDRGAAKAGVQSSTAQAVGQAKQARGLARRSDRLSLSARTGKRLTAHLRVADLTNAKIKNHGQVEHEKPAGNYRRRTRQDAAGSEESFEVRQPIAAGHLKNSDAPGLKAHRAAPMTASRTKNLDARQERERDRSHAISSGAGGYPRITHAFGRMATNAARNAAEKARTENYAVEGSRDKILLGGARDELRRPKRSPRGGTASLTVNFEPSVIFKGMPDQATKQSLLDALSRHSHELMAIIEQEIAKAKRAEFLG